MGTGFSWFFSLLSPSQLRKRYSKCFSQRDTFFIQEMSLRLINLIHNFLLSLILGSLLNTVRKLKYCVHDISEATWSSTFIWHLDCRILICHLAQQEITIKIILEGKLRSRALLYRIQDSMLDNVYTFSVNYEISNKQIFFDDKCIGIIFSCTKWIKSCHVI